MSQSQHFETERLVLRHWRDSDLAPFAEMNADAEVMRYFPNTLSFEESEALYHKIQNIFKVNGWGLWALEVKDSAEFIGFTGLMPVLFEAHFVPAVEVGWRLRRQYWRQGYATEAAIAALDYAKNTLKLPKVVSFTACQNTPSEGVMRKLGMRRLMPNFRHPNLPDESDLIEHLVYEIKF